MNKHCSASNHFAAKALSCLDPVPCGATLTHDGWIPLRRPGVARCAVIASMVWAATCGLARSEGSDEVSPSQRAGSERIQAVSPIDAYYHFVHWMSVGRIDLALEQFTDDAVVVAGPDCLESSPCIGKVSIQANYLLALAKRRVPLPIQEQRFDGQRLRTRGEAIVQHFPGEGRVSLRGGHAFAFRDGLICSVQTELDLDDALTASILEQRRLRGSGASASAVAH